MTLGGEPYQVWKKLNGISFAFLYSTSSTLEVQPTPFPLKTPLALLWKLVHWSINASRRLWEGILNLMRSLGMKSFKLVYSNYSTTISQKRRIHGKTKNGCTSLFIFPAVGHRSFFTSLWPTVVSQRQWDWVRPSCCRFISRFTCLDAFSDQC